MEPEAAPGKPAPTQPAAAAPEQPAAPITAARKDPAKRASQPAAHAPPPGPDAAVGTAEQGGPLGADGRLPEQGDGPLPSVVPDGGCQPAILQQAGNALSQVTEVVADEPVHPVADDVMHLIGAPPHIAPAGPDGHHRDACHHRLYQAQGVAGRLGAGIQVNPGLP